MQKIMGEMRAAMERYEMVEPGDRIAVGVSGGKDSLVLLSGLASLRAYYPKPFEVVALTIDPCFGGKQADFSPISALCSSMQVEYRLRRSRLGDIIIEEGKEKNPCSLCARMRRGILHNMAKEAGCNKLALGHHFDDVIETVLMSMLYGGQVNTMMPKLHSTNFEGMELLRPLYFVKERAIIDWKEENGLHFLQCACRFTEAIAKERAMRAESAASDGMAGGDIVHSSKRQEMKELIEEFRKINPNIENNIFKSVTNVNLDACIGYVKNGERHHFLDEY